MENIIRPTTEADKQVMDVDLAKGRRNRTAQEIFKIELIKQEQEATKKRLPFARNAAIEDYEAAIKSQINAQKKKYGYIRPEELKAIEMDWKQYSDLKNFKVISESERPDTNLSNKNPGLSVSSETKRYQYKDYENNRYVVMEDGPDAIKRAVINRAKLDRQVSAELDKK